MAPPKPECNVCCVRASDTKPLSKCARCQVVLYCSRDHQKEDFDDHKRRCRELKKARDKLAQEEEDLRNVEPDMFTPDDVFETCVGQFWGIHSTRPFMRAKMGVLQRLMTFGTHAAATAAVAEALDCLRYCRGDNMGVRDGVPSLMLQAGKIQECYDFVKWYATEGERGDYDWGDMDLPYLDIHGADMTEEIDELESCYSVFSLAALTYVKMTLIKEVEDAINAHKVADSADLPAPVSDSLAQFLKPMADDQPQSLEDLQALHAKFTKQAKAAFKLTHARNANYWPCVLDPAPLMMDNGPGYYTPGDRNEIKQWILPNAQLWQGSEPFIEKLLAELPRK